VGRDHPPIKPLDGAFGECTVQFFWKNKFIERRVQYGKTDSVGNFSHHSQGKGKERKEAYLDGLL
jgi:hypothetical protein